MDYQKTHVEFDHNHGRPLMACRFAPTGESVFYASEDYHVWNWNWSSDAKIKFPTEAWVRSLAISKDGQTLVTGGYDGRLIWWPAAETEPQPIRVVAAHDGWIRAVAVSPDETTLASVGNDLVVRLWNLSDGTLATELRGQDEKAEEAIRHETFIYNVAFHPNGKSVVTGDLMGQLIHWNLDSGAPVRSFTADSLSLYDKTFRAQIGGFRTLQFTEDGSKLFASGITKVTNAFAGVGEPSVVEFEWEAGKQVIEYLSKPTLRGVAWGAVVHPSGTIIGAHGGSGGTLIFWKPGTAESDHQFKLPQNARDLDLHPDGVRLAAAGSDGHLRICLMAEKPSGK